MTASPADLSCGGDLLLAFGAPDGQADACGLHTLFALGDGQVLHLIRDPLAGTKRPLAALVPLDANGLDRLQAVERLLKFLLGRSVPPDSRLTANQRRRARHMLQAVDGRLSGASYREIANVIYGASRVAADPWKSSSLRDSTIHLVRDGLAMIAGGYRALLRHHRRA